MKNDSKNDADSQQDPRREAQQPAGKNDTDPKDLQPEATGAGEGANRGSPAANVMKQFAKTKAETSGKP